MQAVNADQAPVCAVVTVAYLNGEKVGEARAKQVLLEIVEITVIAVHVPTGFVPISPGKQYTIFQAKGEDA